MNTPVAANSPDFDVLLNAWKVQAMDGVDAKTGRSWWRRASHMSDCWLDCVPRDRHHHQLIVKQKG